MRNLLRCLAYSNTQKQHSSTETALRFGFTLLHYEYMWMQSAVGLGSWFPPLWNIISMWGASVTGDLNQSTVYRLSKKKNLKLIDCLIMPAGKIKECGVEIGQCYFCVYSACLLVQFGQTCCTNKEPQPKQRERPLWLALLICTETKTHRPRCCRAQFAASTVNMRRVTMILIYM